MRGFLLGIILAIALFFGWNYYQQKTKPEVTINETNLIQEQLKNVGKLVVVEGHFSDVLNYKNSKPLFADMFSAQKKALVVVNADVSIAYDLSKLEYVIDEEQKVLTIIKIPEEEVNIHPELEYYDMSSDFLNPFEAKDYNTISETVKASLLKKINASSFKKNSKNQLLNELSKLYILTNSMGWTLKYNEQSITSAQQLERFKD